jgi:hypothetical protein
MSLLGWLVIGVIAGNCSSQCPLWVKSGHLSVRQKCPLYPQKQTSCGEIGNQQFEHVVFRYLARSRPALLRPVD